MKSLMSETVGQRGAFPFLDKFYKAHKIFSSTEVADLINEVGITDRLFSELFSAGLLEGATSGFYISSLGERVALLLRAVNDKEDLTEVYRKLTYLYPELKPYELITENITGLFIDTLLSRSDFIRIYICSPWIRLEEEQLDRIKNSVLKAINRYGSMQIFIVTLPLRRYHYPEGLTNGVTELKRLGAEVTVVTNAKLHAKLYISEPGPYGGIHWAIFGSENLTGRQNIELGIKIENDNELLGKLANFFRKIQEEGKLLEEV